MKARWSVVLLVLMTGCATTQATGGSGPEPSLGARPAVKKELPWLMVPGGKMRTTFFYGPWQCRQVFMTDCQKECAQQGYLLMGCMWLADIKLEWEGHIPVPPLPIKSGGRLAITHCCCNYPTLSPIENAARRDEWSNIRDSFREQWSQRFGQWPTNEGVSWPGHHIQDLQHGGNPVDPNNVIPTEPKVHEEFGRKYPACYRGAEPWNKAGPYWPYTDN